MKEWFPDFEHERIKAVYRSETKLQSTSCDIAYINLHMRSLQSSMEELRSVATEAIEVPNNLGELMVDLQEDLRTHTKALERLNSLVKHMLDTQNHILHVFCFQLDEQYWLELVDPTSPYPFTLRLAPSQRSLQQTKSPTVLLGCISCCIP